MATLNIVNAKKFSDLTTITKASDDAILLIHDGKGVKTIKAGDFKSDLKAQLAEVQSTLGDIAPTGAGAHNSIYRGKSLGTAVTAAQYASIKAGTFEDMYIGDYWTINGVVYRIAAFDYYYHSGDSSCDSHHVTLVPDKKFYNSPMNDPYTTTGGYVGSQMYTQGLTQAKETINASFGSAHILNHRQYLSNAVTDGYVSALSWYDSTVELMTEQNVFGGKIFGNCINGVAIPGSYTIDKSQYPLFAFRPDLIANGQWFWLRDVATATRFAVVGYSNQATAEIASSGYGVRPAFSIVG